MNKGLFLSILSFVIAVVLGTFFYSNVPEESDLDSLTGREVEFGQHGCVIIYGTDELSYIRSVLDNGACVEIRN